MVTENPDRVEHYKLIYDEMRGGVTRQVGEVDEVRNAAGRALGVGSLAASFVVGVGSFDDLDWVAWLLAIFVVAGVGLTLAIWWPRQGWRFELFASEAIPNMIERPVALTEAEFYKDCALHLESAFEGNEKILSELRSRLQWLLGVVGAIVVLIILSAA